MRSGTLDPSPVRESLLRSADHRSNMNAKIALSLMALALAGCQARPVHRGPDVVKVPAGFVYDANVQAARNFFPERPKRLERGYMTAAIMDEEHSSITITKYDGPTTREQVEAAVRAERERYGYADYAPIESLTIDHHPAWAWTELQPKNAPRWTAMNYRAVVSSEDATYLVEFYTTHERFLDASKLGAVVTSFVVNE
jgi:hypothetical protein